jgi:hypothetical protein
LDDYRYSLSHSLRGGCHSVSLESYTGDRLDGVALLAEVLNVSLLVAYTALAQHVHKRISPRFWLGQGAFGDRKVQLGEIAAIQVPDEVGRAQAQCIAGFQHRVSFLYAFSDAIGRELME